MMMHDGWAIITVFSFWGWIGAVVGLILQSFSTQKQFVAKPALFWGGATLFLFSLWIMAMLHA
jgi:hypothetical protein